MVATTRGAVGAIAFAGCGTLTGVSSRGTSWSPEPELFAPACSEAPPGEFAAFGMILVGPSSAFMIGGSDGSIEPPNMARYANAPAVPSTAKPRTAAMTTKPPRRRPFGASSS